MGANSEVLTFPEEVASAGCLNWQLLPDWSTEQELPWACRPEQGVVVKRVYCEMANGSGVASEVVPRTVCKRMLEELRAFNSNGFELLVGGELEFTVAKPAGASGSWEPLFKGVDIFATLQNNKAMDFCYEVERHLEPVGVDIMTMNAEYGAGQLEFTFAPRFGVEAADMTATFRTAVKEIAQKRGLVASFMAKPFGVKGVGNGGHFNFSLWAPQKPSLHPQQPLGQSTDAVSRACSGHTSVFHDEGGLSSTATAFLAGVLAHAPAMEAFCSPTLPCYCRHGNWAPVVANWGFDDRTACVRVKAGGKTNPGSCYMELRMPSASANPYLVTAAVVAAGLDGLRRNMKLPPARQTKEQGALELPASLPDALAALERDDCMVHMMGPDIVRWFVGVKRAEIKAVEERLLHIGKTDKDVSAAWRHMYMEYI